ncbi:NADPH2:quinone reductase [Stackebrandtia albiflava]|uniref:NADPH2:quinone reductase n=1 Tax=Stackebrandtia albiflava TaxID=406432 RepID=A0A562VCU2_9ACTN|nr:quinone oxidoreductase [Stackebrandtia albiflava]TWJ15647.1 NADPH2:quinone reductase [Stackebrandtia albiflava]
MLRAIVIDTPGGPDAMRVRQVSPRRPGPGEVLVDVSACGVNFIDVYHRTGRYPVDTPFTPGLEGAGTVAEVGEDVTDLAVGDLVAWFQVMGSYADQVVAPADALIRVPQGVTARLAAAVLLQGVTAHYLSHSTHEVRPGDRVLIHAAAGGVGLLLTQLVKHRGGWVAATVSTPEKAELARDAGADEVLEYAGFAERVRDLTDGRGVDVVYDGVGADTYEGSLAALSRRGLLALFGQSSGPVPPIDPQVLARHGSLFLTRPTSGDYVATTEEFRSRSGELFALVADGTLSVRIGAEYELPDAARAHRDLEERRTTGKLLLLP